MEVKLFWGDRREFRFGLLLSIPHQSPNMKPQTKSATIDLKRPNMSYNGQVKVALTAQQVK